MRVSNYLLWQISYAELFVSDVLWPDFGREDLYTAIREFSRRNRRFGALDHTIRYNEQTNSVELRPISLLAISPPSSPLPPSTSAVRRNVPMAIRPHRYN